MVFVAITLTGFMKRLSLLIFLAAPAYADNCAVFVSCDKRINSLELGTSLGAPIKQTDCVVWTRWPYRDGLTAPAYLTPPSNIDAEYLEPRVVLVSATSCAAAAATVSAHNPVESDQEYTLRMAREIKESAFKETDAYKELLEKVKKLEEKVKP